MPGADPDGAEISDLTLRCASCDRSHALADLAWRCADCGGVLDLDGFQAALPDRETLLSRRPSLWRYAEAVPVPVPEAITMGEGMTPLVPVAGEPGVQLKVDHLMPTGSFKDRGAVVLVATAAMLGARQLVADSSGNAGSAIAAYASRAGIPCSVYVPATTSPGKLAQLDAYGADVRLVDGSREATAQAAAIAADRPGVFYASHVHHPLFLQGTKTYVFELWEQLGGRLPATLVLPVGNGTLVLGAALGCADLLDMELIDRWPRIVAVQAEGCAPLAEAFAAGAATPAAVAPRDTIAEGIAIARPARGAQILTAVRRSGGFVLTVDDDQITAARAELARAGLSVEATAAACWAAWRAGLVGAPGDAGAVTHAGGPHTVIPLCGSGLKSSSPPACRGAGT